MGFNMMVQTQNAAGLQDLQLFLVWDVMLQEVLRGTMDVGLPGCVLSVGKHTNLPL